MRKLDTARSIDKFWLQCSFEDLFEFPHLNIFFFLLILNEKFFTRHLFKIQNSVTEVATDFSRGGYTVAIACVRALA